MEFELESTKNITMTENELYYGTDMLGEATLEHSLFANYRDIFTLSFIADGNLSMALNKISQPPLITYAHHIALSMPHGRVDVSTVCSAIVKDIAHVLSTRTVQIFQIIRKQLHMSKPRTCC